MSRSALILASTLLALNCNAQALIDVDGVSQDIGRNAGLEAARELSAAADRFRTSLLILSDRFNNDVDSHIQEIDRITKARVAELGTLIDDIDSVLANTINELERIQTKAFFDARKLIWEDLGCQTWILKRAVEEALADTIRTISESQVTLELPIGQVNLRLVTIELGDPSEVYEKIKAAHPRALDGVEEETRSIRILTTYGNISRLARNTSCFYRGTIAERYFLKEFARHEAKSAPWAKIMDLL